MWYSIGIGIGIAQQFLSCIVLGIVLVCRTWYSLSLHSIEFFNKLGILYPKKLVKGINTAKRSSLTKPHQGETEVPVEGNREPDSKDHFGGGIVTIADLVAETANPQSS